jgi:polygalacturonase
MADTPLAIQNVAPTAKIMGQQRTLAQSLTDRVATLKDYGAKGDGSTDDTTAVQAALNSGSLVVAPPGTYLCSNLTLPSYARLYGSGRGLTTFKQKAGSTGSLMATANNYNSLIELQGFTLDGNKANQTSANVGLDLDDTATPSVRGSNSKFGLQDPRHSVCDILIVNTKGSGFRQEGGGGHIFDRIWTMNCDGHGFEILGYDSNWSNLDSGAAGQAGFYFGPFCANNRFQNIKAWYSGQVDRSNWGQGLYLDSAFRNVFSNVETQNTGTAGIKMVSASKIMMNGVNVEFPPNPANSAYGIHLVDSVSITMLAVTVDDRGSSPYSLSYWLMLQKTTMGTGCIRIRIQADVGNVANGINPQQVGQSFNNCEIDFLAGGYETFTTKNWGYLAPYSSDSAAATAGLAVGNLYFSTTLGAITMRRT